MPVLSSGRDAVFQVGAKVRYRIGDFPDFYALLDVPRDACAQQLEEAITSCAADLLAASFSRAGGEQLALLKRHMADFRAVLLDAAARRSYDEQLRHHQNGDTRALPFAEWKQLCGVGSPLTRVQRASQTFKARFIAAFWDAEYF